MTRKLLRSFLDTPSPPIILGPVIALSPYNPSMRDTGRNPCGVVWIWKQDFYVKELMLFPEFCCTQIHLHIANFRASDQLNISLVFNFKCFVFLQAVVDVLSTILEENHLNGWMDLQEVDYKCGYNNLFSTVSYKRFYCHTNHHFPFLFF